MADFRRRLTNGGRGFVIVFARRVRWMMCGIVSCRSSRPLSSSISIAISRFTSRTKSTGLIKIVARYQQFEGANAIVKRTLEGKIKKGLIWHFQGSGKSFLILFAAQKLRQQAALKAPTIVIVDDITADFLGAEVENVTGAASKEALMEFFRTKQRKILITTIFQFDEVKECLDERENIIVLVDEAHRTQEGELGQKMRKAISEKLDRGATFLEAEGTYTGKSTKVVLSAVKRQQISELKELVSQIDPDAFIIVQEAHQVLGDGFSKYSKYSL